MNPSPEPLATLGSRVNSASGSWSGRPDLNRRPQRPERCALNQLRYSPTHNPLYRKRGNGETRNPAPGKEAVGQSTGGGNGLARPTGPARTDKGAPHGPGILKEFL